MRNVQVQRNSEKLSKILFITYFFLPELTSHTAIFDFQDVIPTTYFVLFHCMFFILKTISIDQGKLASYVMKH